jgi:hypothetical protein
VRSGVGCGSTKVTISTVITCGASSLLVHSGVFHRISGKEPIGHMGRRPNGETAWMPDCNSDSERVDCNSPSSWKEVGTREASMSPGRKQRGRTKSVMVEACAARSVWFKGNPSRAVPGCDAVTWLGKEPINVFPDLPLDEVHGTKVLRSRTLRYYWSIRLLGWSQRRRKVVIPSKDPVLVQTRLQIRHTPEWGLV